MKYWYFDAKAVECKTFDYGGCGGNGNKFNTKEDCEASCLPRNFTSSVTFSGNRSNTNTPPPSVSSDAHGL